MSRKTVSYNDDVQKTWLMKAGVSCFLLPLCGPGGVRPCVGAVGKACPLRRPPCPFFTIGPSLVPASVPHLQGGMSLFNSHIYLCDEYSE